LSQERTEGCFLSPALFFLVSLQAHYGKSDPASVAEIKAIYGELQLKVRNRKQAVSSIGRSLVSATYSTHTIV